VNTAQDVTPPTINVATPSDFISYWTISQADMTNTTALFTISATANYDMQAPENNLKVYVDDKLIATGSQGIIQTLYAGQVGYGTHTLAFVATDWAGQTATSNYTLIVSQSSIGGGVLGGSIFTMAIWILIIGLVAIGIIIVVVTVMTTRGRMNETERGTRETKPKTVTNSVACPNCGYKNRPNAKYCTNCGSSMSSQST
jgi:hypothetical protein